MNDLNFPLVLAEFLAKSAIVVAFGFTILAVVRTVFPAAAKHRLWLRLFAASLAIPVLLVVFPRWEIVPNFNKPTEIISPVVATETQEMVYSGMFTHTGGVIFPAPEPTFQFSWTWLLIATWAGGVAFLMARALMAGAYLRRVEGSSKLASGDLFETFTELNDGPERGTTLLTSPLVTSPFTWGLIRPRIVLPESATTWSAGDLEMILLHELEHVRRRDAVSVFISRIFLALNWVNPFAWLANRNAIRFREEACDARVLVAGHTSESYAEMLFRQAQSTSNPFLQTCATAVAETGTIEQRIKMILNPKSKYQSSPEISKPVLYQLIPLFVIGCVLAIGLVGCEKQEQPTTEVEQTASESAEELSHIKLLVDGKTVTFDQVREMSKGAGDLTVKITTGENTDAEEVKAMAKKLGDLGVHNITFFAEEPASPQLALMNAKLDMIIIPSVEFVDTPFADAADFLRMRSRELDALEQDPDKKGINIILAPGKLSDTRLTLNLKNVPLRQALIYCAELARGGIKVDEYAVTIGYEKTPASVSGSASAEDQIAKNTAKLKSIIVPSIEFHETPLRDALEFLQQRSVELDQETEVARKGLNFILDAPMPASVAADPFGGGGFDSGAGDVGNTSITLKLKNVPLSEALRYTCELAGLEYKVLPNAVMISRKKAQDPFGGGGAGSVPVPVAVEKMPIATNEEKLKKIIIPKIEFQDTPLQNALMFIQQKSVELDANTTDPDKKGINIIFNAGEGASLESTGISLKLSNVPLGDALRYTTSLGQLEYKVEPNAIVISPLVRKNAELYTHVYTIPREVFEGMKSEKLSIQEMLAASGVGFSAKGASVTAQPNERRIVMRNTLSEFENLEGFLETVKSGDRWSSDRK